MATENQVNPPLNGTSTVIIRVEDVNDEVPDFSQKIYTNVIKEDKDVNSLVVDVDVSH